MPVCRLAAAGRRPARRTYTGLNFTGATASPTGIDTSGFVGGAHAGFNYQINQFVVGLEGDAEASTVKGTTSYVGGNVRIKDTFRGSIRGRLGFAADRALIYATGGVAFQNFGKLDYSAATSASYSSSRTGWTLGGGIEYAVTNQWSVRAEYRYSDFGKWGANRLASDPFVLATPSEKTRLTDSSVRVGVSYHFGAPAAGAVVAKY